MFFGADAVQFKQPGEDFVAVFIDPAIAPWFLPVTTMAFIAFLVFIVKDEVEPRLQVGPTVAVEDNAVHFGMKLTQLADVRVIFRSVVKTVVGISETLARTSHEDSAKRVVLRANLP